MTQQKISRSLFILALLGVAWGGVANASPFYSVGSAYACDTCHIEPLGWKNPPIKDRKCTLDCVGCHLTPTGGGARNITGRYYGEQTLVMYGERPADGIDPKVYLPKGFPSKGKYSLQDGFSGWWPGKLDHRTIKERYGKLDADTKTFLGADVRAMSLAFNDKTRVGAAAFPMEVLGYFGVSGEKNTFYADAGLNASAGSIVPATPLDALWVREVFVMHKNKSYNSYLRAGRFSPPYGWRIQDHTAFIRSANFNQFRQVNGVEFGLAPNEAWGNVAAWWQGGSVNINEQNIAWPGDPGLPLGFGATAQGGVRRLGYQLGGSAHYMRHVGDGNDELIVGPMWAVNYHPFIYIGELDYARIGQDAQVVDSLTMYNEVHYDWMRGVTPKLRLEFKDEDLGVPNNLIARTLVGVEFNPYKYLQIELDTRAALSVGGLSAEVLLQVHAWFR